jgi:hypothetical protein
MGNILIKFLILVAVIEAVSLYVINTNKRQSDVLGQVATSTPSPTATDTPSPEPTQTPTPNPTKTSSPIPTQTSTPTPTPVPQPTYSSQQINEFIDRFAVQYNVSPHILRYIALCESGFNPNATKLSYAGLYQFGPMTWTNIRIEMGEDGNVDLRVNAEEAVQTAAYVLHVNKAYIWPNCVPK